MASLRLGAWILPAGPEKCVDGLKEVVEKWAIEALNKEQLVREERAVSKKTPKDRGRGVVANGPMCRN